MPWQGDYYYRARKVGGRVVKEYCGTGLQARMEAEVDEIERLRRQMEAEALQTLKANLDAGGVEVSTLVEEAERLAGEALEFAGYHRHKRGEWRKRREHQA